jgi:hypothetical protein
MYMNDSDWHKSRWLDEPPQMGTYSDIRLLFFFACFSFLPQTPVGACSKQGGLWTPLAYMYQVYQVSTSPRPQTLLLLLSLPPFLLITLPRSSYPARVSIDQIHKHVIGSIVSRDSSLLFPPLNLILIWCYSVHMHSIVYNMIKKTWQSSKRWISLAQCSQISTITTNWKTVCVAHS